ncbi:MAG TPA: DUF6325 family protein [Anaerolineales bacterium]|nr:DUF6325 family protein [Anaerolineales bacterium]
MTYGPIDFVVLEFQNDKLKGEIMPALLDLIENKIVKVIDLVIIQKDKDGKHEAIELQELDSETLAIYDPLNAEISGLIQVEDVDAIAEQMANDTTAAALLFENLWAIKFKEAVLNANGKVLEQVRLSHEDVEEALAKIAGVEEKQ